MQDNNNKHEGFGLHMRFDDIMSGLVFFSDVDYKLLENNEISWYLLNQLKLFSIIADDILPNSLGLASFAMI